MSTRYLIPSFIFIAFSFIAACTFVDENEEGSLQYLHISHTTGGDPGACHPLLGQMDLADYDALFLGGDLANNTTKDTAALNRLDELFQLNNPNTFWTPGNHDYRFPGRISEKTGRPLYYASWLNGITVIVLDTQEDQSSFTGDQLAFANQVLDSLSQSSHVLLLTHKLVWMVDDAYLQSQISGVSNGEFGDCDYCLNPNNFYTSVYPKLLDLKEKGIQAICVAGDVGKHLGEVQFETEDGIPLLASGLSIDHEDSKVIVFQHHPQTKQLNWEFKAARSLIK